MHALRHPSVLPLLLVAAFLASLSVATYAEGKGLWAAYNAVGATVALALAVVFWRFDLRLPRAAAAVCFVTAMLHYVGGSLGGHFNVEGINGMYAVYPWWDRVTHFGGAAGVAALAYSLARLNAAARAWRVPDAFLAAFAFGVTMGVGVAVELFEFTAWSVFGTIDQGFYSNTMMDLWSDVTGAAFGAAGAHALRGVTRTTPRPVERSA